MNWDDLKLVRAIGRAGSLSGAARALALSHATAYRRLNALERILAVRLFERSRTGYIPTLAGEEFIEAAARMEEVAVAAERRVIGRDLRPAGTVRVTTTDSLLRGLLTPLCAAFRRAYPDIILEVAVSNQSFDLGRREADIALRPTSRPPERLVGRKVGIIASCIYAAADYCGADGIAEDWSAMDWIGPDSPAYFPEFDRWMFDRGVDRRIIYRVNTWLGMQEAVRCGLGVAVLPRYLCDPDQTLRRLGEPISELEMELWLLTHPDLQRVGRIRALMEFMSGAIRTRLRAFPGC